MNTHEALQAIRAIEPRTLVAEFFGHTGLCHGILTSGEHWAVGAEVPMYERTGDWSFVRDADQTDLDALYSALIATIVARGYAHDVVKKLSAEGRANAATAERQAEQRNAARRSRGLPAQTFGPRYRRAQSHA